MANNSSWLSISQMSGGTGITALSLTALTNDSISAKTATITATNSEYNVTGTAVVNIEGFGPTLSLSRSTLRFDRTGGTATFTVYSNTAWTITYPSMVTSYSASAGTGDTEVTVAVGPNLVESALIQTGTAQDVFNINQLFITFVQEAFMAELEVIPDDDIIYPGTGASSSVTVIANCDWDVECPDWITPSVVSGGSGETVVVLTASPNDGSARSGVVTFYGGGKTVTINVFQDLPYYITVTPDTWVFNYTEDGKTFIVDSYPEWTAEIISTGISAWDVPYVECTFVIPSAMTMNLAGQIWYDGPIRHYGSTFTFTSGGTYKLRYENTGGTAPVLSGNTYLTELFISDGVTTIPSNAFKGCSSLSSVTIGSGLTSVGATAFSGCSSLTSITITAPTAPTIQANSFRDVARDGTLTYPQGSDYTSWLGYWEYYLGYYNWNNVLIDNAVKVARITYNISATGVTQILSSSTGIVYIKDENGNQTILDGTGYNTGYTFTTTGSQYLDFYYFPTDKYYLHFPSSGYLTDLVVYQLPSNNEQLFIRSGICSGITAFSQYQEIASSSSIPDNINFSNLHHYEVGGGVSKFPKLSGNTKSAITELIVTSTGMTSIPDSAFCGCTSLTTVVLSGSITSIGTQAFSGCTSLASIRIPHSITTLGRYVLANCSSLTSVTIEEGVTAIPGYAFQGCTSLPSITIPDSVTSIEPTAFRSCNSLADVVLGDGLEYIRDNTFSGLTSLRRVVIGNSVKYTGQMTFKGCTGLTSVTFGTGLIRIDEQAFSGCRSLSSITFPTSLLLINSRAFEYCYSLLAIISLPTTAPTIKADTFSNIEDGGVLYYPSGSDYSTWMSTANYYLGRYNWTSQEI